MSEGETKKLTEAEQEREAEKSGSERDRLVVAVHRLEARLSSAAPGREREWTSKVAEALADLQELMRQRTDSEDGLLADIEFSAPHLWPRVKRLRAEYARLEREAEDLLAELRDSGDEDVADFRDIRQRIGWLLTALKHQQSREIDLIFEVYNRDIGVCD